jgi:hypothetical protein
MIEMTIDSIRVSLMNYQRVVLLKEKQPTAICLFGLALPKLRLSPSNFRVWQSPVPLPMTSSVQL